MLGTLATVNRRAQSSLVLTVALLVAGCSDEAKRSGRADKPPATVSAATTARTPAPAKSPVRLTHIYQFANRRREVRSTLTVGPAGGIVRDASIVIPAGRRPYRVSVRVDDRGPAPFPYEWARFTLVGRQGTVVNGYVRTTLRRLMPNRRRSPRQTFLTFLIPGGFAPSEVRMTSIVRLWPFKARWRLGA